MQWSSTISDLRRRLLLFEKLLMINSFVLATTSRSQYILHIIGAVGRLMVMAILCQLTKPWIRYLWSYFQSVFLLLLISATHTFTLIELISITAVTILGSI